MNLIRIFFDTNVLVYAHDRASSYHANSISLITKVFEGNMHGIVAEQNIIELYRILTNPVAMRKKPLKPEQAQELLTGTYLSGVFEIVYPTNSTIHQTLGLAVTRNITSAKIFDLRIAALVLAIGVDHLATYNLSDYQNIEGLRATTPQQLLAVLNS
jgi:predicted nucleic acid-binding protein